MKPVSPSGPRRDRKTLTRDGERGLATRLAGLLNPAGSGQSPHKITILDEAGKQIELPGPLANVMAKAAKLLAEGREVSVVADDEVLTTQDAAVRLNVSRQYVVRLVDRGALPAVKVGSHRRLYTSDVEAYRIRRDADRDNALNKFAAISEQIGGYGLAR